MYSLGFEVPFASKNVNSIESGVSASITIITYSSLYEPYNKFLIEIQNNTLNLDNIMNTQMNLFEKATNEFQNCDKNITIDSEIQTAYDAVILINEIINSFSKGETRVTKCITDSKNLFVIQRLYSIYGFEVCVQDNVITICYKI